MVNLRGPLKLLSDPVTVLACVQGLWKEAGVRLSSLLLLAWAVSRQMVNCSPGNAPLIGSGACFHYEPDHGHLGQAWVEKYHGQQVHASFACSLTSMPTEDSVLHAVQVLGHIAGMADAEQAPGDYPTTPALAVQRALQRASVDIADVDFWEINEAFSVVDIANRQLLGLSDDR